jgi:primosomal protein DnaI
MGSLNLLRKEIASFSETKDLKVSDADVITVVQYIDLKKAYNPKDPSQKFEPVLVTEPFVTIEYRVSAAYQKNEIEQGKQKKLDTTYHNDYLIDAKLVDFKLFNDERREALEVSNRFIESIKPGEFVRGMYFFGKYRTGKTYLLSAIANALIEKNVSVVFAYFPDLVRNIKNAFADNSLEAKVKQLKSCGVLILDDVGGEYMTAWFRDEIFGPILQYRLTVGLPVLISSNYKMTDLHRVFAEAKDGVDEVKAMRIMMRIRELTKEIKLSEKSYDSI